MMAIEHCARRGSPDPAATPTENHRTAADWIVWRPSVGRVLRSRDLDPARPKRKNRTPPTEGIGFSTPQHSTRDCPPSETPGCGGPASHEPRGTLLYEGPARWCFPARRQPG